MYQVTLYKGRRMMCKMSDESQSVEADNNRTQTN